MSEPTVPKPGPGAAPPERGATEVEAAMSAVRDLPSPSSTAEYSEADDVQIDLDHQIATLSSAHDTLRRQLSSIER